MDFLQSDECTYEGSDAEVVEFNSVLYIHMGVLFVLLYFSVPPPFSTFLSCVLTSLSNRIGYVLICLLWVIHFCRRAQDNLSGEEQVLKEYGSFSIRNCLIFSFTNKVPESGESAFLTSSPIFSPSGNSFSLSIFRSWTNSKSKSRLTRFSRSMLFKGLNK